MVLQHINPETIGLKTATTSVQIRHGGHIRINERDVEGPGEYDISGVGVHVYSTYATLFTEGIRLTVIWEPTTFAEDEDSNSDAMLFLLADVKQINTIIKEQDPRVVIVHSQEVADELAELDAAAITKENNYKLTTQSLPAEDRHFILLA